ncbi:putative ATP-dependent RNA helicase TDRD12 [Orchesella cincta]|uniref:RNA helicase n=1 Tax=Orchesella cincta TaxID=48709 RepID=A0A1D2MQK9_ORCCI|nr:putative ATP-dependent RNA helicase TDRD12 [Orchesella cincta]
MASVDVTNATCVISFDSPEDGMIKKPTAALRFGYFWKNIRSIDEGSESDVNLVCHFLLTGKEHNFYALYKFSETLDHVTFPPLLKALAVEMELECSEKALCDGIKLFGFCNSADPERCPSRHEFTKQDLRKFAHAPVTGEIEFRITRCESPSRYRVQLLRHFLFEDGKRKVQRSFISELKRRSDLIAECHAQENNLQKTSFEVGNLYAVKDPESNGLTRCKITKILSKDSFDNPKTVHVNCIDTGISLNPSVDDLFQLSPEQEKWTPLVVELVLGDLKPSHGEMEYRPNHSKNARKLTTDKIYNAKIWLSIGNTVWVNPMVEYHIDPCTKQTVKGSSARLDLMRMGAADYNHTHLKSLSDLVRKHGDLYKGCKELEIVEKLSQDDLSEIAAKEDFYQLGDDYRWAFVQLSSDSKFDPAEIMTMYGKNPWTFYGVHRKFEKTLNDLEVELSSCIENYISEKYITYEDMFVELYEPEMVIAAKDLEEDKKWNRAIILSRYKLEDQPSTRYELFFVDHGDKANLTAAELFPIPLKFVTRMPFQSIAFKLEHVVPLNPSGKWEENESEAFLDMILPNCDSVILQLVTLRSVENSDLPVTCRYYEAVAFLDDKELGEILVQESKAEFKTGAENMVAGIKERLLQFYNAVVNQHMGDDDDGESNAAGDNALAFGEEEDEDDRFEVHVDDAFIREFCGIKVNGMNQTASTENAALPTPSPSGAEPNSEQPFTSKSPAANTCGLTTSDAISQFNSSSKLTPTVKWRQNDTSVIFTIMVPDIEEFDVRLGADRRTICFQTVRPANYGFTIKSFGKVIKYEATLTGQTLALSFTKRMAGANWARVLSDKTLQPWWLKPDSDYLGDEDEVDEDGEESDGYEPWVYERDQEDEDTEFILALEADEELGEGEDFASDSD